MGGGGERSAVSEEQIRLAERVKTGVLGIFVNDRDAFLDLLDEESVLVSAGSKVFHGRSEYAKWPLNPPGIHVQDVVFNSVYTNQPDEAIVVGTYLMDAPCVEGTLNQRVTVNLRRDGNDWKITVAHFSNEWPRDKKGAPKVVDGRVAPKRLQLSTEDGLAFVNPEDIVYAESAGKRCVLHLLDQTVTVNLLLHELCSRLPDQFARTNRFYVVNVRYVQSVGRDGILFVTGERVSIPERRVKEIQLQIASVVSRNFN